MENNSLISNYNGTGNILQNLGATECYSIKVIEMELGVES